MSWFKEALPPQLHEVPFIKDTKSVDEFVNNLQNASQYMGNSLRIPGPDAGPDDWVAFDTKLKEKIPQVLRVDLESDEGRVALMKRLGLPDDPKEYGAEGDNEWLAQAAHKAGLTKSQFAAMIKEVADITGQRNQATEQQVAEQRDALYKEWGHNKAAKLEKIVAIVDLTSAPDSIKQAVKDGKADANTLRWLDSIAASYSDNTRLKDDRNDLLNISIAEAQQQIHELLNNPEYFGTSPYSRSLQKKMVDLQRIAAKGT